MKWWTKRGKKWGGNIKKRIKRREEDIGWKDEEKGQREEIRRRC